MYKTAKSKLKGITPSLFQPAINKNINDHCREYREKTVLQDWFELILLYSLFYDDTVSFRDLDPW